MRYFTAGRHRREYRRPSRWSCIITVMAALAALIAAVALAGRTTAASAQTAFQARGSVMAPGAEAAVTGDLAPAARVAAVAVRPAAGHVQAAALLYMVRPGDTLSAVARTRCGTARDWTGIYAASRARHLTGPDPDLIAIGQRLFLACGTAHVTLPRPHPAAVTAAAAFTSHPVRAVRYRCGDGDGDGYDLPCSAQHRAAAVSTWHPAYRPAYHRSYSRTYSSSGTYRSYSYAGTYSYAGLEQLWVSAGGPSWAASRAASIAECESGGRASAYNPSGATGIWQILGSVVAGNLSNPYVNALNAVAKFRASGSTFAQWVCQ